MNNRIVLILIVAGISAAAPLACGQFYSGTVLYPLNGAIPGSGGEENSFGGQTIGIAGIAGQTRAILWTASGTVDLTPEGYASAWPEATDGSQQVGSAAIPATVPNTARVAVAVLWNGTAASAVNLNPNIPGIVGSTALGTNGAQQVGWGYDSQNASYPLLWNGTAASAVNLSPTNLSGISGGIAEGTDGVDQVGFGGDGEASHALLWHGTADSAVDLHPLGFLASEALAVEGNQQVGQAQTTAGVDHAMLWSSTAASYVDLNPTELPYIEESGASGTNGWEQVGDGGGNGTSYNPHALLWFGTAASAVDLQTLLPANDTWLGSSAYSVDSAGNIYGTAYDANRDNFAAEWSPVPEPASGSLLIFVAAGIILRRPKKRSH